MMITQAPIKIFLHRSDECEMPADLITEEWVLKDWNLTTTAPAGNKPGTFLIMLSGDLPEGFGEARE